MRFKVIPEDFVVEERARLPLSSGAYAVYQVRKRGVTTLRVQERLAAALKVPKSAVVLPALKDKDAVAIQYACVKGAGPGHLTGAGFSAELLGRCARPLSPRAFYPFSSPPTRAFYGIGWPGATFGAS